MADLKSMSSILEVSALDERIGYMRCESRSELIGRTCPKCRLHGHTDYFGIARFRELRKWNLNFGRRPY